MSIGIHIFFNLSRTINSMSLDKINKTGFFATNKTVYNKFIVDNPDFIDPKILPLTEWEILEEVNNLKEIDYKYIEDFEKELSDNTFWNAVICDRRLIYNIRSQYYQDYRPVYDQEFILKLLQISLKKINEHFDKVKPHAVIGQNSVTLYDYVYSLIAKSREIPFFQLKLTRVKNYVSLYTNPLEVSPHLKDIYYKYNLDHKKLLNEKELFQKVNEYLEDASNNSLIYEGAIMKNKEKEVNKRKISDQKENSETVENAMVASKEKKLKSLVNLVLNPSNDPHYPSYFQSLMYGKAIKPIRKKIIKKFIFNDADNKWDFKKIKFKYALYPLNTEPEVALLVYGRNYRNQIESVRNIASSLPIGWKLIVKEHPNAIGYRSFSFYKKLIQIPNVILLGPNINTRKLIINSEIVLVVFGTIGLEAILNKKPLITFNQTPYGILPSNMVRFVNDMAVLSKNIKELILEYKFNKWSLFSYIAAHIEGSVQVNLSTGLLGKKGRESFNLDETISTQYQKLALYSLKRINEEKKRFLSYSKF